MKKRKNEQHEEHTIFCNIAPTECDQKCKSTGVCTVNPQRFQRKDNPDDSTQA